MLPALAVALAPVAVGAGLGLGPAFGDRGAGPAATFAVSAAATVVVLELLPASAASTGGWALVIFLAALVGPALLERVASGLSHRVAAALSVVGVLAHQLLDGVEIGTMWSTSAAAGVALSVAAHSIPLVAVVVQPFAKRWRLALGVSVALLAATGLGVVGGQLGAHALPGATTWLPAAIGGLLLHVIWHTLDAPPPRTTAHRTLEMLALVGGVALPLLLGHAHDHGTDHLTESLVDLSLETAPMLLLGLALGAALQAVGPQISDRWLRSGSRVGQALRGALVGAPLPLCACSVLPVSEGLRQRRAGAALVVAFLLATPELGIETFTLSLRFLGLPLSALRLVGAVVAALVAAVVIARNVPESPVVPPTMPSVAAGGNRWRASLHALDELVYHIGPWVAVGVVTAALINAFVTPEQTAALAATGLDLPLVSALAVPSYVCATSATPLAGVLWSKGLSAGAVLAGLLLGPATNVATLAFLTRAYGRKATVRGLVAFVAVVWALGALATVTLPAAPQLALDAVETHVHGWVAWAAGAVLSVLAARSVWQVGPRAWFASLADLSGAATPHPTGGHHSHSHHHHHHHGHGHSHGHHHQPAEHEPPANR